MEWIEVQAKTVDEAVELALDRLGVVVAELEFEVLDEPRSGLFGRMKGTARIRARVKPLSREKPTDRRRRRRGSERSRRRWCRCGDRGRRGSSRPEPGSRARPQVAVAVKVAGAGRAGAHEPRAREAAGTPRQGTRRS